ncbi:MAG: hypothetical protein M1168_03590 [Candidatus Marsarchaeota archaeon]|nr:hypothetical protein [Candidatus Marsarchaeota archaeon]MCL5095035.1 hypothetical protein [Candidatus Marsarchaeota archaeon]
MRKFKFYFISIFLLLVFAGFSNALPFPLNNSVNVHGLNSSFYNNMSFFIPNQTLNASLYYKFNLNNNTYIIIKLNNNINTFLIVNTTQNKDVLVSNKQTAFTIFNNVFSKTNLINQTNLLELKQQMNMFKNESNGSLYTGIYRCLYITGLASSNSSCTLSNSCASCASIPECHAYLENYGGPDSPFGFGIMNFSNHYNKLKSNYSNYFSILSIINNSNSEQQLLALNMTINNISNISKTMPENPIFPINQSTSLLTSTCNYSLPPLQQAWYCVDTAYCSNLTFNNSLITNMHHLIFQSLSQKSTVLSISNTSALLAQTYFNNAINKHNQSRFNQSFNSNSLLSQQYNVLINKSNYLLSKINYTNLSKSLNNLEILYSNIKIKGPNQNISNATKSLSSALNSTNQQYKTANTLYYSIQNISNNNTIILLKDELNFKQVPYNLANIALKQQKINLMLNTKININSANQLLSSLNGIKSNLSLIALPSYSLLLSTKTFAKPFIDLILSINIPLYLKFQFAYLLPPFFALIIGFLIIILIYIFYLALKIKHKIIITSEAKKTWHLIFIALFIFVIIYSYITFIFAQQASNFLPLNGFLSQINNSKSIVIASQFSNSTQNQCINYLQNSIKKKAKTPILLTLNTTCNFISNSSCIDIYLNKNIPIIYINSSSLNFMSYKGLYGNILYINDSAANFQCIINRILFSS